jgi:hypothetical protein
MGESQLTTDPASVVRVVFSYIADRRSFELEAGSMEEAAGESGRVSTPDGTDLDLMDALEPLWSALHARYLSRNAAIAIPAISYRQPPSVDPHSTRVLEASVIDAVAVVRTHEDVDPFGGPPTLCEYRLVLEDGEWRIDDRCEQPEAGRWICGLV